MLALVSAAPEALLETIRSRCRLLPVSLVPDEAIAAGLRERGFPPDVAERAAAESRRRPADAIAFAEQPDLMDDRGRLLERCAAVAADGAAARMAYAGDLAERWRRDREPVLAELDCWESFWEEHLRGDADAPGERARGALAALRAVAGARRDLEAQVTARMALELMLLRFPAGTLAGADGREPAADGSEPAP